MSYIDRDGLIENMKQVGGMEAAIEYVESYPASDVATVVHGEWVKDESGWKCTICGDYLQTFVTPEDSAINYCPTCGATMRVKE